MLRLNSTLAMRRSVLHVNRQSPIRQRVDQRDIDGAKELYSGPITLTRDLMTF